MKYLLFCLLGFIVLSCNRDLSEENFQYPDLLEIPPHFPEMLFPEDNAFSIERWELGKKLFFDPVMSVDKSISCADCHRPDLSFSDNVSVSQGVNGLMGSRNAPSLANVGYLPYFTREGGVPTLEMQVLVPIQEKHEFGFNIVLLAERLNEDSSYVAMAKNAYNREVDPFVITRALGIFERSLISANSPYDDFLQGENSLSDSERRGMHLFYSDKTSCYSCHASFNFTNHAFENNGLYLNYEDEGRKRLSSKDEDLALFKVPSLRNVSITAPYMHDGSLSSLKDVIEHYNGGGKGHINQNEAIRPLGLTEDEKEDLESFLLSLTDKTFLNNPMFKSPNDE